MPTLQPEVIFQIVGAPRDVPSMPNSRKLKIWVSSKHAREGKVKIRTLLEMAAGWLSLQNDNIPGNPPGNPIQFRGVNFADDDRWAKLELLCLAGHATKVVLGRPIPLPE
jgi:hypothetical protein